ncbi:MAG: prepilin-type N-terminal cleavage/methylation domain-containing protein [Phycisphaera sp.]|nr:prepilin-type N-terminal cleavage/methylation domain-containing protein [Phycisphaera sp.]
MQSEPQRLGAQAAVGARRASAAFRGFTLTELLVAIVVLLVIILAVGRIFGTASRVVKQGEANADILQETAAIEQLMRRDLARISDEGFLLIQCIGVRNDVMGDLGGGPLLDPSKPADHIFRCDQMAFIKEDLAISRQTQGMSSFSEQPNGTYTGATPTPQSVASLVYYGHGVSFPNFGQGVDQLIDVVPDPRIQPWFRPFPADARVDVQRWPQGTSFPGTYNASQPAAPNWVLARQETLLADDGDGNPSSYLAPAAIRNSATDLFDQAMESGRVDVVASDLRRLREELEDRGADAPGYVAESLLNYRPRAEKRPPTLDRSDVLLVANTLASNCSNFVIDWTWSDGIGQDLDLDLDIGFDPSQSPADQRDFKGAFRGVSFNGGARSGIGFEQRDVVFEAPRSVPWFGFADANSSSGNPNLDVNFASEFLSSGDFKSDPVRFHAPIAYHPNNAIFRNAAPSEEFLGLGSLQPVAIGNIEGPVVDRPFGPNVEIYRYRAYFGLNGKEPFVLDSQGRPLTQVLDGAESAWPVYRSDYTPWPSAIRVTATFHDSRGAIEGGRLVQFTIPLAARVQDLPEYSP